MALDEAIACAVRSSSSPPTLRLYAWDRPSVSLGVFQPFTDIDAAFCDAHAIPIVRRPTGGRAILHGDELTYSFSAAADCDLFGRGLREAYHALSLAFARAFRRIGLDAVMQQRQVSGRLLTRSALCFQSVSYGELTVSGRKIIGSAQKRWPEGFLQQGSIPFSIDRNLSAAVFMRNASDNDLAGLTAIQTQVDASAFQHEVIAAFEETFAIRFAESQTSCQESAHAAHLAAVKYQSRAWTEAQDRRRRSGYSNGTLQQT